MAVDNREPIFEKALARHLRGADAANSSAPCGCPDAEILAAFHESTLPANQLAAAKQHLHSCARCQEILAHLTATDQLAAAAASRPAATVAPVHTLKPRRLQFWGWAAPAGALAAALLVWIVARESSPLRIPTVAEVSRTASPEPDVAANPGAPSDARAMQAPAPPTGLVQVPSPSTRSDSASRRPSHSKDEAIPTPSDSVAFLPRAESLAKRAQPASPTTQPPAAALSQQVTIADAIQPNAELRAIESEQKQLDRKADAAAELVSPPKPAAPEPSAVNSAANTIIVTGESASASAKARAKSAPAPNPPSPVAQEQQMDGMSRFRESSAVLLANSTPSIAVSAPGGVTSWRLGVAGLVARSSDSGKTWMPQSTGVTVDLLAGSAPSESVCWIVGRAGTILRTLDGGAHWQQIPFPVRDDVLTVTAGGARQATVSLTTGAYQTADGGVTWHKLAPK